MKLPTSHETNIKVALNRIFIVSALEAVSWQCGQAAVGGGETVGDGGSGESQTGVAQLRKVSTTRSTNSTYKQTF